MELNSPDLVISRFLDEAVERHPTRTMVVEDQRSLSYGQFQQLSMRAAGAFVQRGVRPGDRVALVLGNTVEHLAAWFAVTRIGAVAVSVNPHATPAEYAALFQRVRPALTVCASSAPNLPHAGGLIVQVARMFDAEPPGETPRLWPTDVATLIPTSGTTGQSKAVMQTHRTYVLTAQAFPGWVGLDSDDRVLVVLPLHHINAQAYSVMGAIAVGASLVLVPRFSASRFWDQVRKQGVTQFNAVGAMIPILLSQPERSDDADNPVRLCYVALALPEETHRRFERRFGLRMITGYGLSETTFGTVWPLDASPFGSIGYLRQHPEMPHANQAQVVNETGQEVEPGEVGELWLRNPAVMAGYFQDRTATEAVLHDGWLRTGDLVRQSHTGLFTFVARKKEIIRRKGENISPAEIEEVLMAHAGVLEAAVVGIPSPLGEDDIRAAIVLRPGESVDAEELTAWCARSLSSVKLPSEFVFLTEMPRTDTQRIARHKLVGPDRSAR